jgi:hypothetical protein
VGIPVSFDTTGLVAVEPMLWRDGSGDHVGVSVFEAVPDLPAGLADIDTVRAGGAVRYARSGGTLIGCDPVEIDGLPALRQIIKVRNPNRPGGAVLVGSLLIPRARCSAVVRVQCIEGGMTGAWEAAVMLLVGPDRFYLPSPYAPDLDLAGLGALPNHVADRPEYDTRFPAHPLSRLRVLLDGYRRAPESVIQRSAPCPHSPTHPSNCTRDAPGRPSQRARPWHRSRPAPPQRHID